MSDVMAIGAFLGMMLVWVFVMILICIVAYWLANKVIK